MTARLAECTALSPESAQLQVNHILLEAAKAHFPPQPRGDQRLSARPDFQASAKHTWQLYAQMKAAAHATLPTVWMKWRPPWPFVLRVGS